MMMMMTQGLIVRANARLPPAEMFISNDVRLPASTRLPCPDRWQTTRFVRNGSISVRARRGLYAGDLRQCQCQLQADEGELVPMPLQRRISRSQRNALS